MIFRDGFDTSEVVEVLSGDVDNAGFVSSELKIDATLLERLGIMPVTIATGETADLRTAFAIELARFGVKYVMRATVRDARDQPERSEWRTVALDAGPLVFAWQSASAGNRDGYLSLAGDNGSVQFQGLDNRAHLARIRVVVSDDVPWVPPSPGQ